MKNSWIHGKKVRCWLSLVVARSTDTSLFARLSLRHLRKQPSVEGGQQCHHQLLKVQTRTADTALTNILGKFSLVFDSRKFSCQNSSAPNTSMKMFFYSTLFKNNTWIQKLRERETKQLTKDALELTPRKKKSLPLSEKVYYNWFVRSLITECNLTLLLSFFIVSFISILFSDFRMRFDNNKLSELIIIIINEQAMTLSILKHYYHCSFTLMAKQVLLF